MAVALYPSLSAGFGLMLTNFYYYHAQYILLYASYITHTHTHTLHTHTNIPERAHGNLSAQDMLGVSEEVGKETLGSDAAVVASSQEKIRAVHMTSDEHLARQLQAYENILIGTPDSEFYDIISMEPPPRGIEENPVSIPVSLEEPLSDVGLNYENVPREVLQQQDNINPDNMTYEELQSIGEQIGTENKGLSDELISYLPTSKYRIGLFSRNTTDECVVCKTYYKNGQRLIILPCKHRYHADCITQWLRLNKVCPVCNEEVFGP